MKNYIPIIFILSFAFCCTFSSIAYGDDVISPEKSNDFIEKYNKIIQDLKGEVPGEESSVGSGVRWVYEDKSKDELIKDIETLKAENAKLKKNNLELISQLTKCNNDVKEAIAIVTDMFGILKKAKLLPESLVDNNDSLSKSNNKQ